MNLSMIKDQRYLLPDELAWVRLLLYEHDKAMNF